VFDIGSEDSDLKQASYFPAEPYGVSCQQIESLYRQAHPTPSNQAVRLNPMHNSAALLTG